jgi:glutamine amidotransferase
MIAVVDYGMGNLGSITKALEFVGADLKLTSDPKVVEAADKIVVPGVGAFGDGMKNLKEFGLAEVIDREVKAGKPFWGICLGQQLIAKKSYEFGEHEGFGWIDAVVQRFDVSKTPNLKVPHVGWNDVRFTQEHPMLAGLKNPTDFYFVHSYHLVTKDPSITLGICNYGEDFPAIVAAKNIFATQFHPEKSQKGGITMLTNFLTWKP